MVLYYSSTGNTQFIAKQIARLLGDDSINLLTRIKEHDYSEIHSDTPFVICSPVYVCEMPRFFFEYLKNVTLTGNRQVYFIFTSGGYAGIAGRLAHRLARRKGMEYMGRAEFRMPRNYPVSTRYPMLSDEEVKTRILKSRKKIPQVAARIKHGMKLRARYITQTEMFIALPFNPLWVKYRQLASPFYTTDKCIGCGKCERLCPLNNIRLANGKPNWGENCMHCMACLGNCPVDAIEYGDRTQDKPKYRIGKYVNKKYL